MGSQNGFDHHFVLQPLCSERPAAPSEAGVEILGEATVNNLTYQSFLMRGEREEGLGARLV